LASGNQYAPVLCKHITPRAQKMMFLLYNTRLWWDHVSQFRANQKDGAAFDWTKEEAPRSGPCV